MNHPMSLPKTPRMSTDQSISAAQRRFQHLQLQNRNVQCPPQTRPPFIDSNTNLPNGVNQTRNAPTRITPTRITLTRTFPNTNTASSLFEQGQREAYRKALIEQASLDDVKKDDDLLKTYGVFGVQDTPTTPFTPKRYNPAIPDQDNYRHTHSMISDDNNFEKTRREAEFQSRELTYLRDRLTLNLKVDNLQIELNKHFLLGNSLQVDLNECQFRLIELEKSFNCLKEDYSNFFRV